jgi:hypothetical protein
MLDDQFAQAARSGEFWKRRRKTMSPTLFLIGNQGTMQLGTTRAVSASTTTEEFHV